MFLLHLANDKDILLHFQGDTVTTNSQQPSADFLKSLCGTFVHTFE